MLTVKAINNNANSVRIYNHNNIYTKNDLLAAAERVKDAKHANINRRGGHIALSHNIGCNGVIKHKTPRKIQHKLFIDCCIDEYGDGWNWFIDNECYNNIIVVDSRNFSGINNGDYSQLYENIKKYADNMAGEIIDIIHGKNDYYDTIPAAVADMLNINDITPLQTDAVKAAAYNYFSNNASFNEYAAELLTALTPHKWEAVTLRGCCQRDVITALYPADVYSDNNISEYECYFFGMYNEYNARYNGDVVTYYYSMRYNTDEIINNIAADFSADPADVVFNSYY